MNAHRLVLSPTVFGDTASKPLGRDTNLVQHQGPDAWWGAIVGGIVVGFLFSFPDIAGPE